jgi:hypothetical protein
MVKLATAKSKPISPGIARAWLELIADFLAEEAVRQPPVLGETAEKLRWAASCFRAKLSGEAKSLDHAFGLVARPGNPGKTRHWGRHAAEIDAARESTMQAADRLEIDEKNVRRGLQRGRIENERAEVPKIASRLFDRIDMAQQVELADRIANVKRFNRKHHVKPGK